MATRFYLPSTGAAAVSPAIAATWELTSPNLQRLRCVTTKWNTPVSNWLDDQDQDMLDKDNILLQYVSAPLNGNQTIAAQTVSICIQIREFDLESNLYLSWKVYVVSNDGSTVRGTIVPHRRDGLEFILSLRTRYDTLTSSAVNVLDGDGIVMEIGAGGDPNDATADLGHQFQLRIQDVTAYADLDAVDDVATATYNPWVNFGTDTLVFGAEVTTKATPRLTLMGVGT